MVSGKRQDPGDEVGLRSCSSLSSCCLTDTPSSHVNVVVAEQKCYEGLHHHGDFSDCY